jgi:hypothetical protein
MIEMISKVLLVVVRFLIMYMIPLFNTLKLQSQPNEPNSEKNRSMLVYWIIVVLLYLARKFLFFINE